jgi:hypothetical protein
VLRRNKTGSMYIFFDTDEQDRSFTTDERDKGVGVAEQGLSL